MQVQDAQTMRGQSGKYVQVDNTGLGGTKHHRGGWGKGKFQKMLNRRPPIKHIYCGGRQLNSFSTEI